MSLGRLGRFSAPNTPGVSQLPTYKETKNLAVEIQGLDVDEERHTTRFWTRQSGQGTSTRVGRR